MRLIEQMRFGFQQFSTRSKSVYFSLFFCLLLAGCAEKPTSVEGAWLGTGEFRTTAGNAEAKAQLEILTDGTYRIMVLEPKIMMLTGAEKGTWTVDKQQLVLRRVVSKEKTRGILGQLRKGSGPSPDKILTVSEDLMELKLDDGKMALSFARNAEATEKLRSTGEIGES